VKYIWQHIIHPHSRGTSAKKESLIVFLKQGRVLHFDPPALALCPKIFPADYVPLTRVEILKTERFSGQKLKNLKKVGAKVGKTLLFGVLPTESIIYP
jgi:hypothetical protein